MHFDRIDICEAYLALEWDYSEGGILNERSTCARNLMSVDWQLIRMGFHYRHNFRGYDSLSENGKEIYHNAAKRMGLEK
jgi:hypothetical protein